MSRVLFTWELGANYGHLGRDLPVAEQLRKTGHHVSFAVSDTRIATELLSPRRFPFMQAPFSRRIAKLARPPANYAELLLAESWGDRLCLLGLVKAWLNLFSLTRPDVLVADHSPSALLSAYIAGIPRIALGSSFEIPPNAHPLPSIRPWEETPIERLLKSEVLVLDCVNSIIGKHGGKPLTCVAELIPTQAILTTVAELDHYGPRENGKYIGSIHASMNAKAVAWQSTHGHRVLAYLRADQPTTALILAALSEMKTTSIIAAPDAGRHFIAKYACENLTIIPSAIRFPPLLESTEVFISYGGNGVIAETLLAGVPLLIIPQTVEQYLAAKRVETLGAGIVLQHKSGKADVRLALEALFTDPGYRRTARDFSTKYRSTTPERAANDAAQLIMVTSQSMRCNGETDAIPSLH